MNSRTEEVKQQQKNRRGKNKNVKKQVRDKGYNMGAHIL